MVYKHFRVNLILRVLLLFCIIFLFFLLLFKTRLYGALIITGFLIIYQVYTLIYYVEKTNRDLSHFFESIKYKDFSQSFKDNVQGSSFSELESAFDEVSNAFKKARFEKEENYHYLQTIVQHVGIGLIAFQPNGDVELINTAAKRLLKVQRLKNINSLEFLGKHLVDTMFRLKTKEKALVKIVNNNELLNLILFATKFKLRGQDFSLISIQNIRTELEEKEIEAWQKLIRVLTHEIMNSVTPIASLASTINELIQESIGTFEQGQKANNETLDDINQGLQTIFKRSKGLLRFVDAYRNLTLIPKAKFRIFYLKDLFLRVEKLMQANINEKKAHFKMFIEPQDLQLSADQELVEQVLINLLLNSIQAVDTQKEASIELNAHIDNYGKTLIQIKDNGPGMTEENLERIFIPFYSTKKGGSGIGLSLSRQIMRLHKGTINVYSEPSVETVFTLRF